MSISGKNGSGIIRVLTAAYVIIIIRKPNLTQIYLIALRETLIYA
jgi:hypothetical protein